jgi:hypothetical protein
MNDNDVVQVYVTPQSHQAHFLCNILADAGIEARAIGANLNSVDPPANLQSGAVWVRGHDAERARTILTEWEQARDRPHPANESAATWICPTCGETVDDSFELCWNCESVRAPA